MIIPGEPVVTATVNFEPKHMRSIHAVFGEKGTTLAKDIDIGIMIGENPSRTIVNSDTREIKMLIHHKQWLKSIPGVVHEFAHYYHNFFWMEDSMKCPGECHEACAISAELLLAARQPWHKRNVEKRMKVIRDHPIDIYPKALYKVYQHMPYYRGKETHDIMKMLIKDYDHG